MLRLINNQIAKSLIIAVGTLVTYSNLDYLMRYERVQGALFVAILAMVLYVSVGLKHTRHNNSQIALLDKLLYDSETWLGYYVFMGKTLVDCEKRVESAKHGTQAYQKAILSHETAKQNIAFAHAKMYQTLYPDTLGLMDDRAIKQLAKEYREFMGNNQPDKEQEEN